MRNRPSASSPNARGPNDQSGWHGLGQAWTALGTLIAGIGVWGAVGFGLDKLFGTDPWLMVVGVVVGNFAAIYLIYVRALQEEENSRAA